MKKHSFIGRTVRITDIGKLYSTCTEMAGRLGAINWKRDSKPCEGCLYEIVHVGVLHCDLTIVLLIRNMHTGREYLIGSEGIELFRE